ncbi:MAG: ATP-binding protein [Pseudomonadota bacterium]
MKNTPLVLLMQSYQRLVLTIGVLLPSLGIGFLMKTTDLGQRLALHTFHEVAITVAVMMSGFISFVAYKSYQKDHNPFVRFVALAYLGFTIVYTPHGALTYMADHNMAQFLIFGPVSRLIMGLYLFTGLFHLNAESQQSGKNSPAPHLKKSWWPHVVFFVLTAAVLYFTTENIRVRPPFLKGIESIALLTSCLAIWRMWRLPFRSPLMRFHLIAQILFAQASLTFLLGAPWNSLWWFAHALSAAGFMTLGYGVTRVYLGTRSLSTIYDEIMLHNVLDKIVEHSPVGILVVDRNLGVIHSNQMMEKMLAGKGDDKGAANWLFANLAVDSVRLKETLADSPVFMRRLKLDTPDNSFFYEVRIAELDGTGASQGFVCILIDISESHKAEEAIRSLNANLKHEVAERNAINKELESFCYSVSHDLRSPLRAMEGFSHLLEEGYSAKFDEEGRRHLRSVKDNSKKMGQLIDDLLAFSRLGRDPIQDGEVDMQLLVKDVLNNDAGINNIDNHAEIKIGDMPWAHGDITPLRQVWVNLLSNAIKFSSKNPQPVIEISGYRKDAMNIYCVKDNGIGFDMKYYDKLFRVFQRLHAQNQFEGTGVGLAIVQRVVTRHSGRVWAEAEEGKGASFFFSLPA